MQLRRPTEADKTAILDMVAEFRAAKSADDGFFGEENFIYEDWLETIQAAELGLGLSAGFVPYIQFVAFDENGRALGFLNLRLRLNEALFERGGHIGYSIRPTECQKGYAKEVLRQGLLEAREKNIKSVLVTCSPDNEASRRTILANGGVYEDKRQEGERYWINLEGL
ncbi:GNAT family N-acetyltransferase [Streptococcus massiliensis]|uniref:Acetyltransferase n=1 Tax=Streptococcus massiliensis TaxID=313439 RepID=A0A380KZC0_9STRE|nr:GNAT family N-acetyltransferase [Streptococcus massiliensis]SUN76457.1 acetyltransferase [Streptococcus massiliensis]